MPRFPSLNGLSPLPGRTALISGRAKVTSLFNGLTRDRSHRKVTEAILKR